MHEFNCVHCGEKVVVAGNMEGEVIVEGETPVEHMNRTGHAPVSEPRPTGCPHCGNLWMYQGSADRATCPKCRGKATPGVVPEM